MDSERDPPHPSIDELDLSKVYDALSDPTRRRILRMLEEQGELNCSSFLVLGSKTSMSYHLARLRESGLTRTRVEGTQRFMTLREADVEKRFPGLLPAVLRAIRLEEGKPERAGKEATRRRVGGKTGR
jgi:DNA-binding transcriptional ArsR family regulator